MSARTWFTTKNNAHLSAADVDVLNRAARMAEDRFGELKRIQLVVLRTTYRYGMSAQQLFDAATGEREFPK